MKVQREKFYGCVVDAVAVCIGRALCIQCNLSNWLIHPLADGHLIGVTAGSCCWTEQRG